MLDRYRSLPLSAFARLAQVHDVRLVSLQKNAGVEQLADLGEKLSIVDLGPELDSRGAFLDTAAVLKNLDVLITSDTAIAHLAGGLGVPVWVLLSTTPDCAGNRPDAPTAPWYPSMRLYRQLRPEIVRADSRCLR